MVDLHHHLLWGLDDGPRDLDTSLAMARLAVADGITHIVCTPHANSEFAFYPEQIAAKLAQLRERLTQEDISLTLGSGCDFHLSYDNVVAARRYPSRYTINGHDYLLVELPDFGMPRDLGEVFYDLQTAGITPILTHPERNPTLRAHPTRLARWMQGGVLIQLTADSVTGHMGRSAQNMSLRLLDQRWVHLLASDAHNTTSRPPRMKQAAAIVAQRCGRDYADSLVLHNPRAIFDGRPVQPSEAPAYPNELKPPAWSDRIMNLFRLKARVRHLPQVPAR